MKKMNMGFLWLLLGGCFLWNPIVGVKDFLPDAIGYFMLFMGISRLADLNDDLAQAQKAFRSMIWVSLLHLASWVLISGFLQKTEMDMNRYEEPVWVLVFAFVFLALEWYIMLPMWKLFFKGLSDLAEYHGGDALLVDVRGRSRCHRMIARTRLFVVIKAILTVLPEASVLTSLEIEAENQAISTVLPEASFLPFFQTKAENSVFLFDWFPFLSTFRTVAVIIGLVIGLKWLFDYVRLMSAALKDKPWQECLSERYRLEILPDLGLLMNRRVRDAFTFFKIAAIFCINLTVQYRELLPDWVAVILFLCGGLLLGKLLERIKPCLVSGGLLLIVGIIRTYLNENFIKDEWTPTAALFSRSSPFSR